MAILFIDSTYDITIGILNDHLEWIDFQRFYGQKASAIIQRETYHLLLKNNLKSAQVNSIITVAGPGFYTGLRLSEGFADVFQFMNIPHYSFYSYEVPKWCGHKEGTWITKAYRGEYFAYEWNEHSSQKDLMSAKEVSDYLSKKNNFFIHSETSLDNALLELQASPSSLALLKDNASLVFDKVLQNKKREETFYFRAPEDEFRVSGK